MAPQPRCQTRVVSEDLMKRVVLFSAACLLFGGCEHGVSPASPSEGTSAAALSPPETSPKIADFRGRTVATGRSAPHSSSCADGSGQPTCVSSLGALTTGAPASAPDPPTGFTATSCGGDVTLRWNAPPTIVDGYVVSAGSFRGSNAAQFRTRDTFLTKDNVPAGTYYVRVQTALNNQLSVPTDDVALVVTRLGAPENLRAAVSSDGTRVTLTWKKSPAFRPAVDFNLIESLNVTTGVRQPDYRVFNPQSVYNPQTDEISIEDGTLPPARYEAIVQEEHPCGEIGPSSVIVTFEITRRSPLTGTWIGTYRYGAECANFAGIETLELVEDAFGQVTGTVSDQVIAPSPGTASGRIANGKRDGPTVALSLQYTSGTGSQPPAGFASRFTGTLIDGRTMTGRTGSCGTGADVTFSLARVP
jgi:hypothetical protein